MHAGWCACRAAMLRRGQPSHHGLLLRATEKEDENERASLVVQNSNSKIQDHLALRRLCSYGRPPQYDIPDMFDPVQ